METFRELIKYLVLVTGASLVLGGCSNEVPNIEIIQDMMNSPAVKAQEAGPEGMRMPPPGTVPRGFDVYPYKGDFATAERDLKNDVPVTEESLKRGKFLYETYCYVCHGVRAKGDGPVGAKMIVKPPSLVSDKIKAFKDGRIYHIITEGQGVMGSYASQIIDPDDRWKVVNYVRSLAKE